MSKLYFGSTNAYYITVAVDADTGSACYMIEDGTEGPIYPSRFNLYDMDDAARGAVCRAWLREIAAYNCFASLYADCDVCSGYVGVCDAAGALDGIDVYAEIDFA